MIFWLFNGKLPSVWELAMVPPFAWDLKESKNLFCVDDDHGLREFKGSDYIVAKCPNCADPRASASKTALQMVNGDKFHGGVKTMWEFLYRPTNAVQKLVEDVVGQVKPDERLVGVHFRAQ